MSTVPDYGIIVDLFCGGGGATQGIEDAGYFVSECVNHCSVAIDTHQRNHPDTNHRCGDVWSNAPAAVAAGRLVRMLWASPDCRHFSRARGAAPVSRRVRDLAWVVVEWAESTAAPDAIIVENVPEFIEWGPIRAKKHANGKSVRDAQRRVLFEPVPEKKGNTFRTWVNKLKKAGYAIEWRVLDASDYGAASRRKRLYVIARKDGHPIKWPEQTHGQVHHQDCVDQRGGRRKNHQRSVRGLCGGIKPRRSAAEIIDWSDLGTSIFERKRELKPKTLARIAEGIRRYVLNDPSPFLLRVTQTGENQGGKPSWKVSSVEASMPTQTTRQDLAVCTPVVQLFRGSIRGVPADSPLPTITAGNGPGRGGGAGHALGVATPILATTGYGERDGQRPRVNCVHDLIGTCVNGVKQAVVAPVLAHLNHGGKQVSKANEPLRTVVAGGLHHGVVAPVLVNNTTGHTGARLTSSAPTITTGGHAALVAAMMVKFYGQERGGHCVEDPLGTVTTRDRHGLVCVIIDGTEYVIVDVLFRMLKPTELAAAMGFPSHYVWPKTQREAVRLIGNAVSPPQAAALTRAVLGDANLKVSEVAA